MSLTELTQPARTQKFMRYWLLIFMVVLLPLRGWAAGGMATQMATHQMTLQQIASEPQEATETIADNHLNTRTSGHFHHEMQPTVAVQAQPDCHGQPGAVTHAGQARDAATNHSQSAECGSTCGVCQVCHSVALALSLPLPLTAAPAQAGARAELPRFTSADRALSLKPPIS